MIIIIGNIHLTPSDVGEFVVDAKAFTAVARSENGCLLYKVVVEDAVTGRMLVVERWRYQQWLTSHIENQNSSFLVKWSDGRNVDVLKYDATIERPLL